MPKFVTALYESAGEAEEAIGALDEAGFHRSDIQHVDRKRAEEENFFERLFLDQNGDHKERPITVMGISHDEVDRLAEKVRADHSLVIAMCDDERAEEARQILGRFDAVELGVERGRNVEWPEDREEAAAKHDLTPKWFRVVELDEDDLSRGARAHAVHVHPRENIRHVSSDELPGAKRGRRFRQLETDLRVHYEENFADSDYFFDDYVLGYRYGMALADNRDLEDMDWSQLEDAARQGWCDHTSKPWEEFAEAVHFGWRIVHRERRRERRERQEGRWSP